jgi:DNA (cytosine-5)-methyltransferase 1
LIRFVDLFAGTGGIRLGFEAAAKTLGIETECVMSSEINPKSRETYLANFGEMPLGDIHEIHDIADFDFLLGGFPCQPFSYAGKQKGFGDTRGTLFFEIERILGSHKPKGFLLENVRGLTTHDGGKTFETIVHRLKKLGYGVTYVVLNASSVGVPQNRVRVYILGILGKEPILNIDSDLGATDSHDFRRKIRDLTLFEDSPAHKVVKDILEDEVDEKYFCSKPFTAALKKVTNGNLESLHGVRLIDYRGGNSIHSWDLGLKGECSEEEIDFMNALIRNRRLSKFGDHQDGKRLSLEQMSTFFPKRNLKKIVSGLEKKGYLKQVDGKYNPVAGNMSFEVFKFLDPESVSITLVSSDAHKLGIVQNGIPRRLTPREAARLQGYPDSFKVHPDDSVAYFQFGNAVAVPVVEKVLTDFLQHNKFASVKVKSRVKN